MLPMLNTRRQPQQPRTTCSTSSSIGLGIDVLSGVHRRLERGYLCRSASSCCAPHQVRKIPRRGPERVTDRQERCVIAYLSQATGTRRPLSLGRPPINCTALL